MLLFSVEGVSKSYGGREVLKDISFDVRQGEKVALVGANGVGKTTVLRVIAGQIEPDRGRVTFFKDDVHVGYLPQVLSFNPESTIEMELLKVQEGLGSPGASRVSEALKRFDLLKNDPEQAISTLSGGEKTRLALARLWLSEADCLLLDEPTNHLDEGGLTWLSSYIRRFAGTILLVSHDRYFLDETVTRIIELSRDGARSFPGNYTAFREAREREIESQMRAYRDQEKRVRKLREAILRQMEWARSSQAHAGEHTEIRASKVFYRRKAKKVARRAKAMAKRIELLEERKMERPKAQPSIRLRLESEGASGRCLVLATGVGKTYDRTLFRGTNFSIERGDKVGLVGPNGAGKTTLLRIIAGKDPSFEGELWVSPSARIAYFDQEVEGLSPDRNLLEEVTPQGEDPARMRSLLACFLFAGDSVYKRVGTLSAGEKARLALLKMLLSPANILLLDEPTNYLDLPARERVEEALANYDGSLILVSHDRYLLKRVCNKILAIEDMTLSTYLGGYEDYLEKRKGRRPARPHGSRPQTPGREERLILENRLAVLSSELACLDKEDPAYKEAVEEFLRIAKSLRANT